MKRGSTGTAVHWAEARSRVQATIDDLPVHCFIFDFQNVCSVLIAYLLILDSCNFCTDVNCCVYNAHVHGFYSNCNLQSEEER